MKNSILAMAFILGAMLSFSFTSSEKESKKVNSDSAKVHWKAYKVTGSHEGMISLSSGMLDFEGEELVGGSFTIDMTTINCTDLEGDGKAGLEGHLKSDDFFGVENYPTAELMLTSVKSKGKGMYSATGEMTIKGKTNEVSFDISTKSNSAHAKITVDRTKYDIKYGSASFFDDLKDKVIYDEFEITVDLEF